MIDLPDRLAISPESFIAPNATLVGDVTVETGASIWYQAVLRGDMAPITIGARTNIQDGCLLHTNRDCPLVVGQNVTVGHGAILHGATIEDDALIGMGAIILDKAVIGTGSIIGAGTIVPEGKVIPPHHLAMGVPVKVIRELTQPELEKVRENAQVYESYAEAYRKRADSKQI